jgi:glycosyltransferase involved in cell wall biosynthesis
MAGEKRLCLNMIVKNETANLPRCLGAFAPWVPSWVICDTGSTDGTQAFIKSFFAERGIPGELHGSPSSNTSGTQPEFAAGTAVATARPLSLW